MRVRLAKLLFLLLLSSSLTVLAQQSGVAAPGVQGSKTRATQARTPQTSATPAAATPAVSVPYTPGLDVSAMDKAVDPCVDFYAYSCGGWQKQNPIPADQASWSVTARLTEQTRELLRNIMEKAAAPDPHRSAINQKIGDYYASCVDEKTVDAAGAGALKADLERIAALRTKADLPGYLAQFHPQDIYVYFGNSALFRFGSTQDAKNSAEVIAEVDQGGLGMSDRDYYLKDDARSQELRTKYVAHVQKMLELIGEKPDAAAADAQTVMRIETALAKGALTRVQRRDPKATYHRITVKELQALSPTFPWDKYFAQYGLKNLQSLNVAVPEFVKTMEATIAREELPALQAYLRWHLVHAQARWLASPIVEEDFNFYGRALTGQRELQARWKRCVRFTYPALSELVGQAYVEAAFSAQSKQRALKMVQEIESAMERDIRGLAWMSEPTKQQALAKLHAVVNKIGYPDKWRDYTGLKIARGDALGNAERSNTFEFLRSINKIGKPVDRGEWMIPPTMVNANYDAANNSITFPAAVLQPPVFDLRIDDAPNYGDTGGTIGHELTHGFDDQGRQFDAAGNLRDWWQAQDAKEFEQRTQCVIDQYAQYTVVEDVKINSKLTVGEDVADLGGLILAYMAWRDETKGKKLEPIEGLTPEQRFFVGYAQGWCSNERPENLRRRAMMDPHSPVKSRTNGVVSDMPEFQEAFHCTTGQPMAPEKRCRVW
jgi:putative endopeptidase